MLQKKISLNSSEPKSDELTIQRSSCKIDRSSASASHAAESEGGLPLHPGAPPTQPSENDSSCAGDSEAVRSSKPEEPEAEVVMAVVEELVAAEVAAEAVAAVPEGGSQIDEESSGDIAAR